MDPDVIDPVTALAMSVLATMVAIWTPANANHPSTLGYPDRYVGALAIEINDFGFDHGEVDQTSPVVTSRERR